MVFTALAAGDLPESVAKIMCQWTNRLPEDQRDLADDKLVAAALAGMSLQDLAGLFGEIYEQSRSASPDEDKDEVFDDRAVRLITTFAGAGVMTGDLTARAKILQPPGRGTIGVQHMRGWPTPSTSCSTSFATPRPRTTATEAQESSSGAGPHSAEHPPLVADA